jgi:predicted transcriptional regulator
LEKWLPETDPLRNISGYFLEDEATLYPVYERRFLKLRFEKPAPKARKLGSHRRWIRNPIIVAKELEAEMREKGLNQGELAELHGVTRTRVTQYLRLLDLPAQVQDFMADPKNEAATARVTEGALRELLRLGDPVNMAQTFFRIFTEEPTAAEAS